MKVESEPDKVDRRFVSLVAGVSVVVTLLCCLIAWLVLRWSAPQQELQEVHRLRHRVPPQQINEVESYVFRDEPLATQERAQERLKGYGWTNRDQERVHIPLGQAFTLYLQGMRLRDQGRKQGATEPALAPLVPPPRSTP